MNVVRSLLFCALCLIHALLMYLMYVCMYNIYIYIYVYHKLMMTYLMFSNDVIIESSIRRIIYKIIRK